MVTKEEEERRLGYGKEKGKCTQKQWTSALEVGKILSDLGIQSHLSNQVSAFLSIMNHTDVMTKVTCIGRNLEGKNSKKQAQSLIYS